MRACRILDCLVLLCALLGTAKSFAQPDIPPALEPWRDWVLHGEDYRACPVLAGSMPGERAAHVCAWPGELAIDVTDGGATFSQRWLVEAEDWLGLPGDAERWPADVRLDGSPAAVVARDGRPVLRVAAGSHTITGTLRWQQRPASIPVPTQTVLVRLTLDGARMAVPDIDRGALWLGLRPEAAVEEDRLTVSIYRLLTDGLPIRAVTEIQLDVGGQSREIELTGALLPGFVGERLDAELPAQLTADGTLRVQVRPGNWSLRVASHAQEFAATIGLPVASAPWPAEEIWSYAADTRLRVAVLEGADPIDSIATDVPDDWESYPSYRVPAGATVNLVERSRNDADEPNRLSLTRELWLDFAGNGFTALDAIDGTMSSRWRLDMAAPYTMTMAAYGSTDPEDGEILLITRAQDGEGQGVELRTEDLELTTTARVERGGAVPVTGYRESFDTVDTTLYLPPGHRLLAAPGADAVSGAWLNDWRLIDLFLALIVATATWRLLGVVPGLIAVATMVLLLHEPAAPRWIWLNVLVAVALLRVAPQGRLRRLAGFYRNLSLASLVLMLVPFTVTQLRTVVYPQLERPRLERGPTLPARPAPIEGFGGIADNVTQETALRRAMPSAAAPQALDEIIVTARRREDDGLSRYLPGALVQTGPGLPDWAWTRARLRWTSPVDAEQAYRLVILGRASVAAWRLASVIGAFALLWLLARPMLRLPPGLLRGGAGAAAMIAGVLMTMPGQGHAQTLEEFPSPGLLTELKARLTEPAPCHPGCAELTRVRAVVTGETLALDLEIANQAAVAVPVPGAVRGWRADAVGVDGTPTSLLYADAGRYWLSLPEGVHAVRLSGPLPPTNTVTIPFPLVPRSVTVEAPGWDVAGLTDGRLLSGALELVRQQQGETGEALGATEFPPYVRVSRQFRLGLEWTVETYVERIAPSEAAFTIQIPLLPEETVLTPNLEVAAGVVNAAFAAGQRTVYWGSRLPSVASLTLAAPTDAPWTEDWQFGVGQLWHAAFAGLPRTPSDDEDYLIVYLPRPGESLTLDLTRPEPAGGDTIAIDEVDYRADVGQRLTESTIELSYRSTRAEQRVFMLPEGSELDRVAIDGEPVPLRLDGRRLELPVTTGEHDVEIAWRNARDVGMLARLDRVDLGAGATNLQAALNLPRDRWVLWSFGPALGSAILYWSELLVFALAAFALGRLAWSPLRTHEWLLLGLGLSTFAWPTLLLFAVWAFSMSWRSRAKLTLGDRGFNVLQVGFGLLSVAALGSLIGAIPLGLLGAPDMQIVSPVGFGPLSWFEDRSTGLTPSAGAISVSMWFYRAAMLAWALWLSFALLRWLPWAWRAFSHDGLWRGKVKLAA